MRASHTRQTTPAHTERRRRAPEPQKNPRARPSPLSRPPSTPPCPSAFAPTIKMAELGTEALAKRRPSYSIPWDLFVHNTGHRDTRPTTTNSCPRAPALTLHGWDGMRKDGASHT